MNLRRAAHILRKVLPNTSSAIGSPKAGTGKTTAIEIGECQHSEARAFVSYAREDSRFVESLAASLEAAGVRVLGDWLLPGAVPYEDRLREFIIDCNAF